MLPSKGLLVMRMKHMTTRTFLARLGALAVALALASAPAWPQATPGGPAEPPTAAPPATGSRPTLVPNAGDPVDVDEVTLPAKPVAMLSGSATWDEGFDKLKAAFGRIETELGRAGITPAGRPIAVFVQTDDNGFKFDAMIPVDRAPPDRPTLGGDVRFGTTPSGRALRFVHKGPYDDIDSTYETVTAYLDAKDIEVKDSFVEEYVTDLTSADDASLEINIFALPK
jgi:effector-binding domain-containing protein